MNYEVTAATFIMGLKKELRDLKGNIVPMELVEKFLDTRKILPEEERLKTKEEIVETLGNHSDVFWAYSQSEISGEDFSTMIDELEEAGLKTEFPL